MPPLRSLSYVIMVAVIVTGAAVAVVLLLRVKGGKEKSGFTHRLDV